MYQIEQGDSLIYLAEAKMRSEGCHWWRREREKKKTEDLNKLSLWLFNIDNIAFTVFGQSPSVAGKNEIVYVYYNDTESLFKSRSLLKNMVTFIPSFS